MVKHFNLESKLSPRGLTYRFDPYTAGWLVGTTPETNLAAARADSEAFIRDAELGEVYEPAEHITDPKTGETIYANPHIRSLDRLCLLYDKAYYTIESSWLLCKRCQIGE